MGIWTCMRVTYGPLSGFASGWCDLPHWGQVLDGEIVVESEDELELLSPGDIYWCPPGPPGHRFEVADSATVLDYTPTDALLGPGRRPGYRAAAAEILPTS
jgi:quercetin dioxygenase-like cupin family protein